jgi:hypothetical protein
MVSGGIAQPFLTAALNGDEWSASSPSCFTLRERAPSTHWIGDRVGPRASLDAVEKRRILSCHELYPGRLARHYTD